MAILDAAALLSRRGQPATAGDHGAQAHRARDQADGLSAPRRFRAIISLLLAVERLHDDLRAEPCRAERAGRGGRGGGGAGGPWCRASAASSSNPSTSLSPGST